MTRRGVRWTVKKYIHKKCGYKGKLRVLRDGTYLCPRCKFLAWTWEIEEVRNNA